MDDNLHPHDLRRGGDRREHLADSASPEAERRSGIERREDGTKNDEGSQQ